MVVAAKLYIVNDDLLPEDLRFVIESGSCHLEPLAINENMTQAENHDFQAILDEFAECFAHNLRGNDHRGKK